MLFLPMLIAAAAPQGPAILHVHSYQFGEQFAYFSSFERCEAFRRRLEAEWIQASRTLLHITSPTQSTPAPLPGTETKTECIAG